MGEQETIRLDGSWQTVLDAENKRLLEERLPAYLRERRWFGGKASTMQSIQISEAVSLADSTTSAHSAAYLTFLRVEYTEGPAQTYVLPLAFASGDEAGKLQTTRTQAVVARLNVTEGGASTTGGVLYDATWDPGFGMTLLEAIRLGRSFPSSSGEIVASHTSYLEQDAAPPGVSLNPSVMSTEQSNTSLKYGDRFMLKLYRRLEEGTNPDLEIGRFLLEEKFPNVPPLAGAIEYQAQGREPVTLAILQGFIPNNGDAWSYTLAALDDYLDGVLHNGIEAIPALPDMQHPLDLLGIEAPALMSEAIGAYLASARLLGRRTAEMHLALASGVDNPDFAPEPFSMDYQQVLYTSVQQLVDRALELLSRHASGLPSAAQAEANAILENRRQILSRFEPLISRRITAEIIRCHGDYHLGQVLYTGEDFVIIDFEGEPVRSLSERRRKHSPLRDVAGMLRSFHYASHSAAVKWLGKESDSAKRIEQWTHAWHVWVSAAFLTEYLDAAAQATFLPQVPQDLRTLLDVLVLEKAVYELIYELNNRPDWVGIPLRGIAQLVLPEMQT